VFASGVDVLLTPTTLTTAPTFSSFTQRDNRTNTEEQDVFTQSVIIENILKTFLIGPMLIFGGSHLGLLSI
jgi:Asp-tRNA(Asn)/Glu-tRNA(Gln) amidotransferase A subunit family amidase